MFELNDKLKGSPGFEDLRELEGYNHTIYSSSIAKIEKMVEPLGMPWVY